MVGLLGINILIALVWPTHPSHRAAERWFGRHAKDGWATCPITQAGFVRVLASPAFSPHGPTAKQAREKLGENVRYPAHHFWPDLLQLPEALNLLGTELAGHRQVTDAYLLALALHNQGKFVTLDRSVANLLRDEAARKGHLEVLI
jgi:toxin-antitoxin system PIN domain toxin